MTDAELLAIGARRMVAEAPHSAPCRVSLVDAAPGESLILVHHDHLTDPGSPYRSGGPVFVRENAVEAEPVTADVPDMLARRLLSVRLYDAGSMMIDAEVVEGSELDGFLRQAFANPATDQIHLHTARRGCFVARAVRL